jgi:uroporphyrinogen decarboxylase
MDGIALRKKFGKELILGGHIDKRAFLKGEDVLKEEVMRKVPYLCKTGGFFPGLDHAIPPDVPFENFKYFINLLREIAGRDKLPD